MVTLTELLPNIRQLTFFDKVQLIRILAEEIEILKNQEQNYILTPQFEASAASVLMQALKEEEVVL